MHQGDVGPFGVVTLVLTLLLQVACAAALLAADDGWLALWTAVLVARLAMVRTGLPGVAVAAGSSLGRAVAGTVLAGLAAAAVRAARRGLVGRRGLLVAARPTPPRCSAPPSRDCSPPRCCTAARRPGSAGRPAT